MITKEQLEHLQALHRSATPGPWRWWTSNSFRRLSSDLSGKDGDVLHGITCRDGCNDVRVSEADMDLIAELRNHAEDLLDAMTEKLFRDRFVNMTAEELRESLQPLNHEQVARSRAYYQTQEDENDNLRSLLRIALQDIEQHSQDYHHVTKPELLKALKEAAK